MWLNLLRAMTLWLCSMKSCLTTMMPLLGGKLKEIVEEKEEDEQHSHNFDVDPDVVQEFREHLAFANEQLYAVFTTLKVILKKMG